MKKIEKIYTIFSGIVFSVASLYALFILFKNFFRVENILGKVYMLVFILTFVFAFSGSYLKMLKMEKLAETFSKIAIAIFLTIWLAFTGVGTYAVITTKDYSLWYILVAFWLFFFLVVYKEFIKKK